MLKDIEVRYGSAFAELDPGAFKSLIDYIDFFLDLLADPRADFRVKLANYAKVGDDVFEFCRFYERWLGNPLIERLKHEVYELLEQAISWCGWQDLYDVMEV